MSNTNDNAQPQANITGPEQFQDEKDDLVENDEMSVFEQNNSIFGVDTLGEQVLLTPVPSAKNLRQLEIKKKLKSPPAAKLADDNNSNNTSSQNSATASPNLHNKYIPRSESTSEIIDIELPEIGAADEAAQSKTITSKKPSNNNNSSSQDKSHLRLAEPSDSAAITDPTLHRKSRDSVGSNDNRPSSLDDLRLRKTLVDAEFLHDNRMYLLRNNPWWRFFSRYLRVRNYIWSLFDSDGEFSRANSIVNWSLCIIVLLSVAGIVLSTEEMVVNFLTGIFKSEVVVGSLFLFLEYSTVLIFSLEYALRVFSCTASKRYNRYGDICGRIRYIFTIGAIIDLLSIVPSYVLIFVYASNPYSFALGEIKTSTTSAIVTTPMRMLRFLRLIKIERQIVAFAMITNIVKKKLMELVRSSLIVASTILIASTLMYILEQEVQPEAFGSIPRAIYFTMVTLGTFSMFFFLIFKCDTFLVLSVHQYSYHWLW